MDKYPKNLSTSRTLYDEMIFSDEFNEQFENNRIFLKELRDKYNNIYDTSLEVLNFLSLYKDFVASICGLIFSILKAINII